MRLCFSAYLGCHHCWNQYYPYIYLKNSFFIRNYAFYSIQLRHLVFKELNVMIYIILPSSPHNAVTFARRHSTMGVGNLSLLNPGLTPTTTIPQWYKCWHHILTLIVLSQGLKAGYVPSLRTTYLNE